METIALKAPAKINTVLDIKGIYPNGYHILDMIMLSIDLCDEIILTKTDDGKITLTADSSPLAADNTNLVYKAIDTIRKKFGITTGIKAEIKKVIPMSAGLAGGSADCAAALKGMLRLFDLRPQRSEIYEMGKSLGADVPFCLFAKPARAQGIGEILTPLPDMPRCKILLAKPAEGMPTLQAFKEYDSLKGIAHPDIEKAVAAMEAGDLEKICQSLGNVLEAVTIKNHPIVGEIKAEMLNFGAKGALMSGSGSSVFGIFIDDTSVKRAFNHINEKFGLSEIFITRPLKSSECEPLSI